MFDRWLTFQYSYIYHVYHERQLYTLLRQREHYHHGMFRHPTAAMNLFHVGKQYLTFWQVKTTLTRNLIGRKIISNVKRSDTRNSLHTVECVKVD